MRYFCNAEFPCLYYLRIRVQPRHPMGADSLRLGLTNYTGGIIVVYFIGILLFVALLYFAWPILLAIAALWIIYRIALHILKEKYFESTVFRARKQAIAAIVQEHNDIVAYVDQMRNEGSFELGTSSTGTHALLATFENTSHHNYRRDRNVAQYQDANVHNCSLQVARNAAANPLKYLMKYFAIKPTEEHLEAVEELGESISRLEEAIENLQIRESDITKSFSPPTFILKHFKDEFMQHTGVNLSPVVVPYPKYTFEYVSAGGNSSQRTVIELNTPTIDELIATMSQKIKWRKSAERQRALMTAKLREQIKIRDDYTCQYCSVSVFREPHLLLEIDHIIPVSRGGLSVEENLQTLCWRCNRRKSDKVLES